MSSFFMTRPATSLLRLSLLLGLCATLGGCHSLFGGKDEKAEDSGKRIPVLEVSKKPKVDTDLSDFSIELPTPLMNESWAQVGGNTAHMMSNALIGPLPQKIWKTDVGSGTGGAYRLLAAPVVADGRIFTMDAKGRVAAFSAKTGDRIWKFDTTPEDRSTRSIGGGVALSKDVVYATTGFGEVLALSALDGTVVWRKLIGKPIRSAPTIADDRVFVVTLDNELNALSTKDGRVLWHHNGIAENATLMGSSAPAVEGDNVVVAYSSGEIFSLRAQNGRVAWTDVLAAPAQVGALPAIADIRGLPVLDQNTVYAVSHSDRMAAIDLRTGERVWEADIGGVNTPVLAKNAVYVVTNENQLMALTRTGGRIVWVSDLPRYEKPDNKDSKPLQWWGPVLAGGRLWMTNSMGQLASFATDDGTNLTTTDVADRFFIAPIVADNVMYLLADDGTLYAMK